MPTKKNYQKHRKEHPEYYVKLNQRIREDRRNNPQKYRERERLSRLRNPDRVRAKSLRAYYKQREKNNKRSI